MTPQEATWADKIQKLLAKAESTTPEEAELLVAKAQQLMARYAIDEAMLGMAGPRKHEIIEKDIVVAGGYAPAHAQLAHIVAQNNGCRMLSTKQTYARPPKTVIHIIGYEDDVAQVELLFTSLMVQGASALNKFVKDGGIADITAAAAKFQRRRSFLFGFASGVGERLRTANAVAKKEYVEERVAAGDDQVVVSNSLGVAVRDKSQQVQDWVDKKYGKLRYGRGLKVGSGRNAGADAGRNANVGNPAVGGSAKAIGRG